MQFRNITLLVALVSLAFAGATNAQSVFNFSYTFADGGIVTGSLTGTPDGNFVDNVSNVTMSYVNPDQSIDITEPTPIYIYQEETIDNRITYVNGAVVSFDPTQNNFVFSTGTFKPSRGESYDAFIMLPTGNSLDLSGPGNPYDLYYVDSTQNDNDDPITPSAWTLTEVPEPSTWTMLTMGGVGLFVILLRGRFKKQPMTTVAKNRMGNPV